MKDHITTGKKRLVYLTATKAVKMFCLFCKKHRGRDVDDCMKFTCKLRSFRKGQKFDYGETGQAVKIAVSEHCREDCSNQFQDVGKCEDDLCVLRHFKLYERESMPNEMTLED